MRSSVSVILSSPAPDPNMSRPDFEQNIHDHSALLVLVKHLGEELSAKHFNFIFERISHVSTIKVTDGAGIERNILARYIKEYPVGNNDWGDFQTHRRLLGLITLGKCKTASEFNEICRVHESLKVKYQSTLYDSRCIVFGINTSETDQLTPPSNFKSTAIYYSSENDPNPGLEERINEFLSGLFWILESKRLERGKEKVEKVSLLLAPFEKRDFVGLDMESRSNRKRCTGRLTKHLGDLSLQAGLIQDALTFYHTAIEILRSINDWLWIGNSAEGLCAASAMLLFPKVQTSPLHRNASLQERNARQRYSSLTSGSSSIGKAMKLTRSMPQNVLFIEDIYKSYRETILHYSKYQHAGVVETEACFKAAKIAVKHNSALQAHSFLQHVIFVNLQFSEEEKIQRLLCLSELYSSIGFHRKASFYKRLTAMRYVAARNPQTSWDKCYQLLLQSLRGHNLTLDPNDSMPGWPKLQRLVLQDLVVAAKRLGNLGLATRHMTFLIQVMWNHMIPAERQESALQLQTLSSQCEGSPIPLVLDSGLIIPPANLLTIPQPLNFSIQNLKPSLRPHRLQTVKEDFGPFLFTPLSFGSLEKKNVKKSNKLEYQWVVDEVCEVVVEFSNPLSIELEVTNMLLLTNGVVFESIPLTVTLPPSIPQISVVLTGTPKEAGNLEIVGYSTHTLGVKSNCRLRHISTISQSVFTMEVVPALPTLQLTKTLPSAESSSTLNNIILHAGESSKYTIQLKNASTLPVELLEVSIESTLEPDLQRQIIQWSQKNVQEQLPLPPEGVIDMPIYLFGASNFLVQPTNVQPLDASSVKSGGFSAPNSLLSSSSPRHASYDHTLTSASTFSVRSGGASSLNSSITLFKTSPENAVKLIECQIKVRYSGGPGMASGYCRIISTTIYVEIVNSLLITNWDVLPAETSSQFYLVLDIANMTNYEMELNYTKSKIMLVEEGGTCRVPVPVDRCPITSSSELTGSNDCTIDAADIIKICCEHITSQVSLKWKLNGAEREGFATLNGLVITEQMLDLVRMSPIHWEVLLNSVAVKAGCENKTHEVGNVLQIGVWVHNSLSWPLINISLHLHFYQDYQNGVTNNQLDTCLATVGATDVTLPKVLEHGSVYHECNVVFFSAGVFKLNVQCCSIEKHIWKLIPPIEIQVVDNVVL